MSINLGVSAVLVYLMVFARLSGMIMLNPIFGRIDVPGMVRAGFVLFMALLIAPMQPTENILAMGDVEYIFVVVRELFVGAVYGYVFSLFYYLLYLAGDLMDTDFGLSMAKSFDPATSIQASFSGKMLTAVFILYIFATGSHLALIRMYAQSFELIPLGTIQISTDIVSFCIKLFAGVFGLALRLVAPFMVAEFVLQLCMGILMKFIPQISVFVINFQLRILLGLIMLFLFAPYIGQFIDNYITTMFDALAESAAIFAKTAV